MKKKYHEPYEPYGINIKYEFKTYRNVESNYYNRKKLRKKYKDKVCITYDNWEQHIQSLLIRNCLKMQNKNFIHWLYQQRKNVYGIIETIKAILIPIYVTLPSLLNAIPDSLFNTIELFAFRFFGSIFIILIIMLVSTRFLRYEMKQLDFFDEVIAIAQKELEYQLPNYKF